MMSMYNYCDGTVHFKRRKCSTSPAVGVQLKRYIQYAERSAMSREDNKPICPMCDYKEAITFLPDSMQEEILDTIRKAEGVHED